MMYYVYMLGCGDGTIYTGITNDVQKRIKAHMCGEGAKYTRGRGPFEILSLWKVKSRSQASKVEYFIKKNPRDKKKLFCRKEGYLKELIEEKKGIEIKKIKDILSYIR